MSKRYSEQAEQEGPSAVSKGLGRNETRRSGGHWEIDDGLSQLTSSRDDSCDDAMGVLSNTGGRYQNTVIRSEHFNAPRSTFNNVQGTQNNIVNVNHTAVDDKATHEKILRWLAPTIPSANYHQALKTCHSNTGQWFLEDKRFMEWKANPSSLLWLHGKPGCGKTVLCSVVIQNIFGSCDGTAEEACAYFFFDGRDSQTVLQRHEQLLRSLIWQFFSQAQQLPEAIESLYNQYGFGTQQPSVESLQTALLLVLRQFHSAYLIVDALDECTDRIELLDWIKEIMCWKNGRLHFFATSREDVDIKIRLTKLGPVSICLEGDSVNADVAMYLDSMLHPDPERKTWRDHADTCNEVKASLTTGAQGMFRWVALQLEVLRGCRNQHQVKKQLARLPKDLNETYDRILGQIEEKDHEDAVKLFQWLAFSVRPLKLSELAEVVQVDFESGDLPWFNSERRYDDTEDVLRVCSGFVSMNDDGDVKLAHLSVKEYMLSCEVPQFRISEATSHSLISKTCLAYLAQFDRDGYWIPDHLLLMHHPLAQYAAEHWTHHGIRGDVDNEVSHQQLALNVFQQKNIFLHWIAMQGLRWEGFETGEPIYYASKAGLKEVVRVLLEDGADVNAQAWNGTSLREASSNGHEVIVKILLQHGADVNAQRGDYGSSLQEASSNGHKAIVKILLEHGADVNAHGRRYSNSLQLASSNGHEAIVKILLEHGADVNAQPGFHRSSLWQASSNGHEAIVKILLEHGADVNAQRGNYGCPLWQASSNGHEAIVKILLQHGAHFDAQVWLDLALQVASSHGHEAIVKILLEHGADVNAQEDHYGSSLRQASSKGHEAIVKILLEHGADVNAQLGIHDSSLCEASSKGHEAIVKILLENGADVNAQPGFHGSSLCRASSRGHEAIVKILLEHGADINAQRGDNGSSLWLASLNGHEAIVKILLEHGADVNARAWNGSSLCQASVKGHEAIVKILLENGADVNAQRGDYDSPLWQASSNGHEAIVKILLEHGAHVNAQEWLDLALQVASSNGHEAIVRILLEHGADVNAQDHHYGSSLQGASSQGHQTIVEILLEHGADVNAHGGHHGSSLRAASSNRHDAIVKMLLEHGAHVNDQAGTTSALHHPEPLSSF